MKELTIREIPESRVAFDLPDTDGLQIEGRLCGSMEGPLVVGLHGLSGSGNERLPFIAGQALYQAGFNSLWPDFYNYQENTRDLHDCTLDTHVDDFGVVVDGLHEAGVEEIYAVGHSIGGLIILMSKVELKGAVTWDASHGSSMKGKVDNFAIGNMTLDGTSGVGYRGRGLVYPLAMVRQMEGLGNTTNLAEKDYPLKFIIAGKGILAEYGRAYYEAASEPSAVHMIPDANHGFDNSTGMTLEIAGETVQWFVEIENDDSRHDNREGVR